MAKPIGLNLKQLEAFVLVSDLGSFSKAAEQLNTTQPNISTRIARLETSLKVKLLDRDPGSVRLTTKGRALLPKARQVLRATEDLVDACGQPALINGTLRLGVTEFIVHTWLRRFLKALQERLPNIRVELVVDISVSIEKQLFDGSIDLALQNEPFRRRAPGNESLGAYPLVWVAAPQLASSLGEAVATDELATHTILAHARGTRLYEELETHFHSCLGCEPRLVPSSNLAACLHMTLDGMGVALLPAAMVWHELKSGQLMRVDYGWSPDALQFLARYDAERAPRFVANAASLAGEVALGYISEIDASP